MGERLIKDYTTEPDNVEAAQVTEENKEAIARWCGGQAHEDGLIMPTLDGPFLVNVGDYAVRQKGSGKYFGMEALDFEGRYRRDGLR